MKFIQIKKGFSYRLYDKAKYRSGWSDPLKLRLWLQCLMKAAYNISGYKRPQK